MNICPLRERAKLYMRQFYNEDGSIVYNEYIDDDAHVYVFDDARLYSKEELSHILFENFIYLITIL